MSRRSIHINIPKPCHERWDAMDATDRGAFCHSCQKEVIDFSAMTDREVIEYLERHTAGCGRFRKDQLDNKLTIPEIDNGIFRWKALLLGLISFAGLKSAVAAPHQHLFSTDQSAALKTEKKDSAVSAPIVASIDTDITVCGQVIDEHEEGMISATIVFIDSAGRATGLGTVTDFDGNFSLTIHRYTLIANRHHAIKISFAGYQSQTIQLSNAWDQGYTIKLEPRILSKSDLMMVGCISFRPLTPGRKIENWFRRTFRIKHH